MQHISGLSAVGRAEALRSPRIDAGSQRGLRKASARPTTYNPDRHPRKRRTPAIPLGRRTTLRLEGAATFPRLPWPANALEDLPPNTELHVDFEQRLSIWWSIAIRWD